MKFKIFLPGIILLALIGVVYGYESFVQLDVTGISQACCPGITQIGGSSLTIKICNLSNCTQCQGENYQGGSIGYNSYVSEEVELTKGQRYYFCMDLAPSGCPPTYIGTVVSVYFASPYSSLGYLVWTKEYSPAEYYNLNACRTYNSENKGSVGTVYGFQITGCPYQQPGPEAWGDIENVTIDFDRYYQEMAAWNCWTLGKFPIANYAAANHLLFPFPFIA